MQPIAINRILVCDMVFLLCPKVLFTLTQLPYWVGLHGGRQNGKRRKGNPFGFFSEAFCGSQDGGGGEGGVVPIPVTVSGSQDFEAIHFPEWKEALASASLAPEVRERYRRAILTLLKVCKDRRRPASVALIREHLAVAANAAAAALRW